MALPDDPVLRRFEVFLNQQIAEITFFRVLLQTFLWNTVRNSQQGPAFVADLKEQVLLHLQNTERGEGDPQDFERMLQLQLESAERFFEPIEEGIPAENRAPPKKPN